MFKPMFHEAAKDLAPSLSDIGKVIKERLLYRSAAVKDSPGKVDGSSMEVDRGAFLMPVEGLVKRVESTREAFFSGQGIGEPGLTATRSMRPLAIDPGDLFGSLSARAMKDTVPGTDKLLGGFKEGLSPQTLKPARDELMDIERGIASGGAFETMLVEREPEESSPSDIMQVGRLFDMEM